MRVGVKTLHNTIQDVQAQLANQRAFVQFPSMSVSDKGHIVNIILINFLFPGDVLITFDDLLHLGSPPFELQSLQEVGKLAWRPLMWRWLSDSYGTLVNGVFRRAARFK